MLTRLAFSAAAVLSATSLPRDGVAPGRPDTDQLAVTVSPLPDADAGARKGGWICLPNGRFETKDFVRSIEELELSLHWAFAKQGLSDPSKHLLRLDLNKIDVQLCARNFMPGKSGNYSGSASFQFLVQWKDGAVTTEIVNFEIGKGEAMTEAQILYRATRAVAATAAQRRQ